MIVVMVVVVIMDMTGRTIALIASARMSLGG
jgi:hypothetical protein